MPIGLLRGVERPIPTVTPSGGTTVIYVRDDAPDDFTYALAKALDEHSDLFRTQILPWYYDRREVWKTSLIPLAKGAAKYYRERGYMQ
jgi:TRAP-type uncharacterized transport system substrate-binding protein